MTDDTTPPDQIEWTDDGKHVTVTARNGTLYASLETSDVEFERQRATLDRKRGHDVLNAGIQRDNNGEKFRAWIVVDGRRDEIEALQEASEPDPVEPTDDPLRYTVEEYTKTIGRDWKREVTRERLAVNKSPEEMTDRQKELHRRVNTDRVPDDADVGDEYAIDDLLDDARTHEEREQDALDEAAETGEEVVISKTTRDCNDPSLECSLDHVTRVATPDGEITTKRTHTY